MLRVIRIRACERAIAALLILGSTAPLLAQPAPAAPGPPTYLANIQHVTLANDEGNQTRENAGVARATRNDAWSPTILPVPHPDAAPEALEFPQGVVMPAPPPIEPPANELIRSNEPVQAPLPPENLPPGITAWWQEAALRPLQSSAPALNVDSNSLVVDALRHSARVQAISDHAVIAETAIVQALAEFDVHAFSESKMVRTSVPTGSVLDAGFNVPRLREEDWYYNAGIRKKDPYGGRLEVGQRVGTRDSNSSFFFPANQGNSRLTMSYTQPLLNRAGHAYNNSLVVLANLDTRIARDRFDTELQDHLLRVTESMWDLYLQRTSLLQKKRHLERAEVILQRLEKRREVDSFESQIIRARAAVAMRRVELVRSEGSIHNVEARIRSLVNSPDMLSNRQVEIVPTEPPARDYIPIRLEDALVTALQNRPEIDAVTQEIEAARVRLNMAKNEMRPILDVVLETYVSGLRQDFDIGRSLTDQFSTGEPSYTAGFVFEVPLYGRAACARQQRRQAELRQLRNQLDATLESLRAEVEVAVREIDTSYRELFGKYHSMLAADADVEYLQRRWELLPGDDRAASFLLEDLLDSQDRLAGEERAFAEAQVNYTVSLIRLNRATGVIMKAE